MSDVRLIDANALKSLLIEVLERIKEIPKMTIDEMHIISGCHMLCEMIDDAHTIDAVEVVRCRECFYKDIPKCCPYQINGFEVVSNWYCPMGVRKMDAKDMDVPTKDGGAADANSR